LHVARNDQRNSRTVPATIIAQPMNMMAGQRILR
jgi:hypothetical protein